MHPYIEAIPFEHFSKFYASPIEHKRAEHNFLNIIRLYKYLAMPQARYFVLQAVELIIKVFGEKEVYVCESGLTPSGKVHLGNFFDICIADAIKRALEMRGLKAKHIIAIDSMDPFRRPPVFAPREFIKEADAYIGMPFDEIPDPWGCHENYALHFTDPLINTLDDYGVEAEVKTAREIHAMPRYVELLHGIIKHRREVINVLNEVRSKAGHKTLYPLDWIPYRPQCSKCRRIDEKVKPIEILEDGKRIKYVCEHCGNEGIVNIMKGEGKAPWRIEWPLRWLIFDVVFEPLGKDHMASGSSYDTAKALIKKLYKREPPIAVFYDFVLLRTEKGVEKFSKRKGIGLGVDEWLRYAPPEVLRFMILRRDTHDIRREALPHWLFDPKQIPKYVNDFDKLEEAYFSLEKQPAKMRERIEMTYKLSLIKNIPKKKPVRVPYLTAAIIAQRAKDLEDGLKLLIKIGKLPITASKEEIEDAKRRLKMAKNWVSDYAPEYKFILPEIPEEIKVLSEKQIIALQMLLNRFKEGSIDKDSFRKVIWDIAEEIYGDKKKSKEIYQALYYVFSGKPYGPPLSKLIFEVVGEEFIIRRLEEVMRIVGTKKT